MTFTWKEFQARNNNELVAIFGNFINRAVVLTHKYFEGRVPVAGTTYDLDQDVIDRLNEYPGEIAASLDNFKFREALNLMMEVARMGNKYLADTEPWKVIKEDQDRVGTILNISLQIAASLAILATPFLPKTCKKLNTILGLSESNWSQAGRPDMLEAGHQLSKPELLFEKIEDPVVENQIAKLQATKNENTANQVTAAKPSIAFEDFTQMDIRIGRITKAEKVPKSKKLLKLQVDTGVDKRTIVSGIAQHYTVEQLVGQQVTVLLNLTPRKIMGIESQGMVLMAENSDGTLAFLQPDKEINPGGEVS